MNSFKENKFWMPDGQPDYLSLKRDNATGRPETKELFLLDQSELLRMILKMSNAGEIKAANYRIQDSLSEYVWTHLPDGLLDNPATPQALMFFPAEYGTTMWDWKDGITDALEAPEACPEETKEEVKNLYLENFLCRLL